MLPSLSLLLACPLLLAEEKPDCTALEATHAATIGQVDQDEQMKAAIYNAGVALEGLGCPTEASALYRGFVQRWPSDERSETLSFRLATQAMQGPDTMGAIALFDDHWKSYPSSEHAQSAVFEAARLREGLGDLVGAAAGFEHYATRWPLAEDAPWVMARACVLWTGLEDHHVLGCWDGFLRQFGKPPSYLLLRAQHHRIAPLEQAGRMEEAEEARRATLETFDRLVEAGEEIPPAERALAAALAFEEVEHHATKIGDAELSGDEMEDGELLKNHLPRWTVGLDQACSTHVSRFKDPETAASCLQLQAAARYKMADLFRDRGATGPIVGGLDEGARDHCARALELEPWTTSHQACLELLHQHHPERYPASSEELER